MPSLKCPNCGMVNFVNAPHCKRCQIPFQQHMPHQTEPTNYPPPANDSWGQSYQPNTYHQQPNYRQPNYQQPSYYLPPLNGPRQFNLGAWQRNGQLVTLRKVELPERCVKCNDEADEMLKQNLQWHNPALYILILLSPLIYLIVILIVRKKATIYFGLCNRHKSRRDLCLVSGGIMMTLGVLGFFFFLMNSPIEMSLVSFLVLIIGIVLYAILGRTLTPDEIDDQYVYLKGAGEEFVDSLPHWHG